MTRRTAPINASRECRYRPNSPALPNTCASDGREYTHLSLSALSTAHSVPQILTHVVHSNCVPAVTPAGTVRALPVPSILQWSAEHHAPTPTLTFLTRCMCRARPLCTRRTDRALFLARARTRACAPTQPRTHAPYVSGLPSLAAPRLSAGATASPCRERTAVDTRYDAAFHTPPPVSSFSLATGAVVSSHSGRARGDSQVVGSGLRDPRGGTLHSGQASAQSLRYAR
ncbi:hypothetical protein IEO21_10077 [Rhodonia placenta]|uniref:Uncharacterized protein n=1 Tax=Rhodonia placenta TaxID=104341 RepID=A0A8H7NT60_9APHY|nr:hypothetical protein IEO21_10077 [Postia placenta]